MKIIISNLPQDVTEAAVRVSLYSGSADPRTSCNPPLDPSSRCK